MKKNYSTKKKKKPPRLDLLWISYIYPFVFNIPKIRSIVLKRKYND